MTAIFLHRPNFCRSVSSSSYGETVGGSGSSSSNGGGGGGSNNSSGNKYTSSISSGSIGSSLRERNNLDTPSTAADIISRYSPAGYVPNIQRQASGNSAHHWRHRSASSSLSELVGGDEREFERSRDFRPESSLSSSSSSSSAVISAGLWPKSNKRKPFTSSTVLTTTGHARADNTAILAEVTTTVDDHVTCKLKDNGKTENDVDDDSNDTKDLNGYDDRHNNNGNGRDGNGDDVARRYGVNNNDDERDDDNDGNGDDDVDENGDNDDDDDNNDDDDEDDNNDDDDNLNNRHRHRHYHLHQQRGHQLEEMSPIKRNLLSSAAAAGGGGGLIGVSSINLLTNHATNPCNIELLINNNTQDKLIGRKEEEEEEEDERIVEVATSSEVTRGVDNSVLSTDAITFLQNSHTSERDVPEKEERNTSYNNLDDGDFSGTPPLTQNGIAGRPSVAHGDDPSVPSTSRRTDQPNIFSSAASGSANSNLTSSPTNPSTTHHSIYRGVNEQYVSVLVRKIIYLGTVQHGSYSIFV